MANVKIKINGKSVTVPEGTTILEAARKKGVYIPTLCAYEGLKPKAACRLCTVNVKGEDKEKLACAVKVTDGMVITIDSDELLKKRKAIVEEMFRQHTVDCHHCMRLTHSNWSAAFSRSVIPTDAAICCTDRSDIASACQSTSARQAFSLPLVSRLA